MTTLLLKDYLRINDMSQSGFAALAGLNKQAVSYWLKPDKDPVYVEYNVITTQILKVHSENVLYRAATRWEAEKDA